MRFKNASSILVLAALASSVGAVPGEPIPAAPAKLKADGPVSPPTLEGDTSAAYMAQLRVTNLSTGDVLFWDCTPDTNIDTREYEADNSYVFSGPSGTYKIKARGTQAGHRFTLTRTVTLTGGLQPPPGPQPNPPAPIPVPPGPVPPIPPQPSGAAVSYFVVVEDTSKAGAWRGDILGSPKVESFYKALRGSRTGSIHRLVDINAPGDDPAAKYFSAQADGKALPWLWMLDSTGAMVKDMAAPTTPDSFVAAFNITASGEDHPARKMGLIHAKPKLKWTVFGSTPSTPIIPRAQWKPVSLEAFLPPVYDQDGRGQCNAGATCNVIEAARAMAGLPYVHLSAGDLYSQINGGRDDGSTLEDGLAASISSGIATAATVPYVWDGRNHGSQANVKSERALYKVVEAYICPDFDSIGSALQQGFFIVEGITWGTNDNPDKDGWIPAQVGRVAGGHALCGYGIAQRNSVWGVRTRNDWSSSWGGSADGSVRAGNCVIPETRFDGGITGYWAVRTCLQNPTQFPYPHAQRNLDPFRDRLAVAEKSLAW